MNFSKGFNKEMYYKKIEKMKEEDYVHKVILKLREISDEEEKRRETKKEAESILKRVSVYLLNYPDALDNTLICLSKENEHDLYLVLKLEIDTLNLFAASHNLKSLEKASKNYKKFRENPFSL